MFTRNIRRRAFSHAPFQNLQKCYLRHFQRKFEYDRTLNSCAHIIHAKFLSRIHAKFLSRNDSASFCRYVTTETIIETNDSSASDKYATKNTAVEVLDQLDISGRQLEDVAAATRNMTRLIEAINRKDILNVNDVCRYAKELDKSIQEFNTMTNKLFLSISEKIDGINIGSHGFTGNIHEVLGVIDRMHLLGERFSNIDASYKMTTQLLSKISDNVSLNKSEIDIIVLTLKKLYSKNHQDIDHIKEVLSNKIGFTLNLRDLASILNRLDWEGGLRVERELPLELLSLLNDFHKSTNTEEKNKIRNKILGIVHKELVRFNSLDNEVFPHTLALFCRSVIVLKCENDLDGQILRQLITLIKKSEFRKWKPDDIGSACYGLKNFKGGMDEVVDDYISIISRILSTCKNSFTFGNYLYASVMYGIQSFTGNNEIERQFIENIVSIPDIPIDAKERQALMRVTTKAFTRCFFGLGQLDPSLQEVQNLYGKLVDRIIDPYVNGRNKIDVGLVQQMCFSLKLITGTTPSEISLLKSVTRGIILFNEDQKQLHNRPKERADFPQCVASACISLRSMPSTYVTRAYMAEVTKLLQCFNNMMEIEWSSNYDGPYKSNRLHLNDRGLQRLLRTVGRFDYSHAEERQLVNAVATCIHNHTILFSSKYFSTNSLSSSDVFSYVEVFMECIYSLRFVRTWGPDIQSYVKAILDFLETIIPPPPPDLGKVKKKSDKLSIVLQPSELYALCGLHFVKGNTPQERRLIRFAASLIKSRATKSLDAKTIGHICQGISNLSGSGYDELALVDTIAELCELSLKSTKFDSWTTSQACNVLSAASPDSPEKARLINALTDHIIASEFKDGFNVNNLHIILRGISERIKDSISDEEKRLINVILDILNKGKYQLSGERIDSKSDDSQRNNILTAHLVSEVLHSMRYLSGKGQPEESRIIRFVTSLLQNIPLSMKPTISEASKAIDGMFNMSGVNFDQLELIRIAVKFIHHCEDKKFTSDIDAARACMGLKSSSSLSGEDNIHLIKFVGDALANSNSIDWSNTVSVIKAFYGLQSLSCSPSFEDNIVVNTKEGIVSRFEAERKLVASLTSSIRAYINQGKRTGRDTTRGNVIKLDVDGIGRVCMGLHSMRGETKEERDLILLVADIIHNNNLYMKTRNLSLRAYDPIAFALRGVQDLSYFDACPEALKLFQALSESIDMFNPNQVPVEESHEEEVSSIDSSIFPDVWNDENDSKVDHLSIGPITVEIMFHSLQNISGELLEERMLLASVGNLLIQGKVGNLHPESMAKSLFGLRSMTGSRIE